MKIAVIGYSGSGKSTLAARLGEFYRVETLHLDRVHWLPGWRERPPEEECAIVGAFLDAHESWVIDGNYARACYERRMEEADRIVLLAFGRWTCLWRAFRRFLRYRGRARASMAPGCDEKFDAAFVRWILWDGRTQKHRKRYADTVRRYPEKTVVLRSQRELDRFLKEIEDKSRG